jgi:hypothetical protein
LQRTTRRGIDHREATSAVATTLQFFPGYFNAVPTEWVVVVHHALLNKQTISKEETIFQAL